MAIRRRANRALSISAGVFAFANIIVYFFGSDGRKDEENLIGVLEENITYSYIYPPRSRNPVEESIRLNELIANSWYKCKRTKRIPDEPLGFHLCVDEPMGLQHVFSGDRSTFAVISSSTDDYRLEKTLLKIANNHGALSGLVISDRPSIPISLRQYQSNLLYSTVSVGDKSSIRSLAALLSNQLQSFARDRGQDDIDILKIGCVDCWRPDHLPILIQQLHEMGSLLLARQLHLIISIDRIDHQILYMWYRTIMGLFFVTGNSYFALYAAQQSGECGRTIASCLFQLAFARIHVAPPAAPVIHVLTPVAGMGSPEEEYNRLIWYLNRNIQSNSCMHQRMISIKIGGSEWMVCDSSVSKALCLIYHFSIGGYWELTVDQFEAKWPEHCSIRVFDPTIPYDGRYSGDRISLHGVTLGNEDYGENQPGLEPGTVWRVSTLQRLLEKTNGEKRVISLLILDLHGGEWDIFEQLLSAAAISAFSQLIMRIRVWRGEENENYRQFYSWFHRLEKSGFQLFNIRPIINNERRSTISNFTNANMALPCEPNWCYEMGWISPGH